MREEQKKRKVILVTDGDQIAQKAIERAAKNIGARCISASAGNPTPINGGAIVNLIKKAAYDPVVVMFDDNGSPNVGAGEQALNYVAGHQDIEVMGIIAVASNVDDLAGASVDYAITQDKEICQGQVNKEGKLISEHKMVIGDTVNIINDLREKHQIFTIGIGDLGKMEGCDNPNTGAEITTKAMQAVIVNWENKNKETQA